MNIIAIDPGASGGVAIRTSDSVECFPMPSTQGDLIEALRSLRANNNGEWTCYIEQVGGFVGKGQPGSAMFKFGESFGFIKGVVQTLGIRLVMVRPQTWQKRLGIGTARACASKTEWKNKLKAEAQRRFPNCDVTLKTADALLILDWAVSGGNAVGEVEK